MCFREIDTILLVRKIHLDTLKLIASRGIFTEKMHILEPSIEYLIQF